MARKSHALRLSQATDLVAVYADAGMSDDYRARFTRDMAARLGRNKGLSKRQREWLDTLIEEGVPTPKGDPALIARIEAAQAVKGMKEYDINILGEFLTKVRNDWKMSEKQTKWLSKILAEADRIAIEGPYTIDEETTEKLRLCLKLANGYNGVYWDTHGGTRKALESVKDHLAGTGVTDEWCVNKLLKSMAGRLREVIERPYVTPDKPCWVRVKVFDTAWQTAWSLGVVAGDPEINDRGAIVYPILTATGSLKMATKEELAKRKPQGA